MIQSKYNDEPVTYGQALVTYNLLHNPDFAEPEEGPDSPAKRIVNEINQNQSQALQASQVVQSNLLKSKPALTF